jgi:ACS family hexuronate transporter-like MFS transporter
MGLLIDRIGLNAGAGLAVGSWSLATLWHAGVRGIDAMVGARLLLGVAQGGGIPAAGKAMSTYLEPGERALGNAMSQIGISLGLSFAPLLANAIYPNHGWRPVFAVAGLLGFLWLPLWFWLARRTPQQPAETQRTQVSLGVLLSRSTYWGLVIATMLTMTVYSFWTNFAVEFLVLSRGIPAGVARGYSWMPFLAGGLGGIAGGVVSLRMSRAGIRLPVARRRSVAHGGAIILLATALAPMVPTPALSSLCIGVSFFFSAYLSVNLYALPLDLFGRERAAFTMASITFAYGAMQSILSPWVGWSVEHTGGFNQVCLVCAILPVLGVGVLFLTRDRLNPDR